MPTYIVTSSAQPIVQRGRSRHRSLSISVPNIFRKRSSHREPSVLRRGRSPSRARSRSRAREYSRVRSKSRVRFITEDRHHYAGRRYGDHDRARRTVYVAERSRSRARHDDRHYGSGHTHVRRRHSLQAFPRQDIAYYYTTPSIAPHSPVSPQPMYHAVQHAPQVAPLYSSPGVPYIPGPPAFPHMPAAMGMPPAHPGFAPATYAVPVAPPTSPYAQSFPAPPVVYAGQPQMATVQYAGDGVPGAMFHPGYYAGSPYGGPYAGH